MPGTPTTESEADVAQHPPPGGEDGRDGEQVDGPPPPPDAAGAGPPLDAPATEEPDDLPDGPPPPPFVRERARGRRRRRILLGSLVAVLLLSVSVGVVVAGGFDPADEEPIAAEGPGEQEVPDDDTDDDPRDDTGDDPLGDETPPDEGGSPDTDADPDGDADARDPEGLGPADGPIELDADGRPDREVPEDETVAPPDLSRLDLAGSRIAELFLDIDASERVMLGFQLDAREAFGGGFDATEPDEILELVATSAGAGSDALGVLRDRLLAELDDPRADPVREAYRIHLDSWVRYLDTVAADPGILLRDTTPFTVDINRTADAFVRAVDELTQTTDLDRDLRRYIDEVVQRGFPDAEDSQV